MAKVITVKLGLDADEALGILGGVNKQLRAAFNVPTTQLNVVRGLFKNIQDSTTYTKKQFDSLVNKSSSILGQSVLSSPKQVNRSLLNTTLSNIKTDLFDVNSKIATEINNILKTPPASITKKQQALLTDWQTELSKKVDEYVPVPKGLNLNNVSWANNINPLVGQANKYRITETTLNSLLDIDNNLQKSSGKFELPYLDKTKTQDFYNSLTDKKQGVFKILDDEYDRLVKSQAYNKRNADAYLASSNAELSYIQEYLTARGISGLDITRSTDEEFKAAKLAAGLTDTTDIDELFKRATTTRERQNTLNNVLKNVRNAKNNKLINDLRQYRSYVNKTAITDKADNIEQYRNNLLNIHSTKSAILDELNNSYKLGLSNNYTDEQFKRAVEEYKQRDDHIDNGTKRLNQLNRAYTQARTIEGKTASALQQSEELVEEQTIGKNIENINERFKNLNQDFSKLQANKEWKRITKKGFFSNPKIVDDIFKADLTNLQKQQDIKLKELSDLAKSKYNINLHGDYSNENFLKAAVQAFNDSKAEGNPLTKEARKNIVEIGRSIATTNRDRIRVNDILTADQQERERDTREEQERQRTISNLQALSMAAHRIGSAGFAVANYGYGDVKEYVKYQSSVVGIAKLLPALRDQKTLIVNDKFKDFREGILKLTERLPSSGVELAHSAEVAARLGVTDPDRILDMVDLSSKLGATFGMAPDDVTQQVVKIANAKGYDFSDPNIKQKILDNVADPINYLDDHTAASGREILNFTKKSASIGEQVGMSTKDVAAFGATLISLGITSDSAATAFKNLITVMQTGARNQKKGKEYLEKAGFTQQELMEGIKKAPTATALKFLQQLNKLKTGKAGEDAASIARFGFGQMSLPGILALVNNPDRLKQYIEMANSGAKNWTEIEYRAKEVNDPAIRFATMQNKYKELQITLGESLMPLADDLIKTLKGLSNATIPLVKDNKGLIKTTAKLAIGTGLLGKVTGYAADATIVWHNLNMSRTLGNFGRFLMSTGAPLGIGGASTTMLGSILGVLLAGGLGAWIGTTVRNKWGWFNTDKRVDRENKEEDNARNKARGDIKTAVRRNRGEHGDVFKTKRRDTLIRRFQNEKSKDTNRNLNIFKDENGKYNLYKKYLYGNDWKKIKYTDLTTEQQQLFNEIERLNFQIIAERKRHNIAPKGVLKKDKSSQEEFIIDPSTGKRLPVLKDNLTDYNNYVKEVERVRNVRVEKASKTWQAKEDLKNAKSAYDYVQAKKELISAEKEERYTKEYEKKLLNEYGKQINWKEPDAYKKYLAYRAEQAAKTPEQLKEDERKKRQEDYLNTVKQLGFKNVEEYELSQQQNKVDYLTKQYQALKDLAGEGSDPNFKDLNAYYNKNINPYGYYGIEEVGKQLDQAKQKLQELQDLANNIKAPDFLKTMEDSLIKSALKDTLPFGEYFNIPENNLANLNKSSSTTKEIASNIGNMKDSMPEVVNNFASLGNTDLSNLLLTTSGIASNLKAIKETGNININLGFTIKPPEEYNQHK